MTDPQAERPFLAVLTFVAGMALLVGAIAACLPRDRLREIILTSAAGDAAFDPISIGYREVLDTAAPTMTWARAVAFVSR